MDRERFAALVARAVSNLSDRITIFQKMVEAKCRGESQIASEIERVIRHEIAHHFGISDQRLNQIESGY